MVPKLVERPAENLLVVTAAVERNNEVVRTTMTNNMQWIQKVMAANNLEAAGPVRIITNEMGVDTYSFDVAQPVRKRGAAAATAEEDGEPAAAAAAQPAATGKLDIKLEGPVTAEYLEPSRVATMPYAGHMANLPNVRDAVRGWAMTRGYETVGRPYESWNAGISESFTPEGKFDVYWTIK